MKKKVSSLIVLVFLVLIGLPVYAIGYEEISPVKLILQLIFYIIVFVAVIFFTLYGTKLIGKNLRGVVASKYIKLLDVLNIPGGTKIIITKINDKIYILATTNNNTNLIDIIDGDSFHLYDEKFDNYLSKYLNDSHNEDKLNKKMADLLNKINFKKDKEGKNDEKKY